jgi:hypothetical protein
MTEAIRRALFGLQLPDALQGVRVAQDGFKSRVEAEKDVPGMLLRYAWCYALP